MTDTKAPEKGLEHLQEMIKTQGSHGNWNYTPYMTGMLNGLLLAASVVTDDHEPEYRDIPAWCIEEDRFRAMMNRSHEMAKSKGWWEGFDVLRMDASDVALLGSKLALIHSEVSEALEELRSGDDSRIPVYYDENGKPEGFVVEMADAVIRIMDICGALGVNLDVAMRLKMDYNEGREHRHGGKAL